jgi:hypothetical protein
MTKRERVACVLLAVSSSIAAYRIGWVLPATDWTPALFLWAVVHALGCVAFASGLVRGRS